MGRYILLYLFLSALVGLAACAPQLEPEESCNFVQNSLQRRVSWLTSPLVVGIEDSFPSRYEPEIKRAMEKWNEVIGRAVFHPELRIIRRDQTNAVNISLLWESNWHKTPNANSSHAPSTGEQAKTSIGFQSDNIYTALVYYNAEHHNFIVTGENSMGTDMASLSLHELGHALGLDHINKAGAVMNPRLALNTVRMEPTEEEVKSLHCEY